MTSYEEFVGLLANEPTHEQREVITCQDPAIAVIAGAGSGKTATMAQRITWHIVAGNVRPDQALGLTFTRTAAAELAQRVEQTLHKAIRAGLYRPADEQADSAYRIHSRLQRPHVATYHSFAADIVATYGLLIGVTPDTRVITDGERWQIMERIVSQYAQDPAFVDACIGSSMSKLVDTALSLAESMNDHDCSCAQLQQFCQDSVDVITSIKGARLNNDVRHYAGIEAKEATDMNRALSGALEAMKLRIALIPVIAAYRDYCQQHSLMEFSDQVRLARQIISDIPSVGRDLSEQYRLVLLDEYQDTSVNQAMLIEAMFRDSWSVCAVGDPNQSLYSWRGASANGLSDFMRRFKVQKNLSLSVAFRNDQQILHAANALTSGKCEYPDIEVKELRKLDLEKDALASARCSEPEEAMAGQTAAYAGRVLQSHPSSLQTDPSCEDSLSPATLAPPSPVPGDVVFLHRMTSHDLRVALARRLAADLEPDVNGSTPSAAVLCRGWKEIKAVSQIFDEWRIPYEVIGGQPLIERAEVKLVRHALTLIAYPERNEAVLSLFNFYGIGAQDLMAFSRYLSSIAAQDKNSSRTEYEYLCVVEGLEALSEASQTPSGISEIGLQRFGDIAHLLADIRQQRFRALPELINGVIDRLNLRLYAQARPYGGRKIDAVLSQFVEFGASYAAGHPGATIREFVDWLDALDEHEEVKELTSDDVDEEDCERNGVVQIATVHAAKGLEWDIVAVMNMGPTDKIDEKRDDDKRDSCWLTSAKELPYPLRMDARYLPAFSFGKPTSIAKADLPQRKAEVLAEMKDLITGGLRRHRNAEERRIAYVALTRARHKVYICSAQFNSGAIQDMDAPTIHSLSAHRAVDSPDNIEPDLSQQDATDQAAVAQITAGWGRSAEDHPNADSAVQARESVLLNPQQPTGHEPEGNQSEGNQPEGNQPEGNRPPERETNYRENAFVRDMSAHLTADPENEPYLSQEDIADIKKAAADYRNEGSGFDDDGSMRWPIDVQRQVSTARDPWQVASPQERMEHIERWRIQADILAAEHQRGHGKQPQVRDYFTASGLVKLAHDPVQFARDERRPIPVPPSRAARIGTDVHERIAHWYQRPLALDIDDDAQYLDADYGDEEELTQARAQELFARFEAAPFAHCEPIAVEEQCEVELDGIPVRCVIDAVLDTSALADYPDVMIVDWKTGHRPSVSDIAAREWQLALYRLAWSASQHIPVEQIGACFYYLGESDPQRRELSAGQVTKAELVDTLREYLRAGGLA
ncbi:ATP-dependent helicase [Trueperella sp. LYQ143]|uniref:ATP-dependent helicase n=1 Tax=Trueperella sp. LYQ143 TaxID=3391059 RepID=UPI0039834F9E